MKNAFVMIINLHEFCVFGVPITKLSNLISCYHEPIQMQYLNLLPCSYCPSAARFKLKYCSREAFLIAAFKGSTQTNYIGKGKGAHKPEAHMAKAYFWFL